MTPETTLRDRDHTTPLADALRELGECLGEPIDGDAVARALTSGLPDLAELQADVAELQAEASADARRIGRLEGMLRSLLVAGDGMACDLAALHFEARVSAQRWDGVAELARGELEVGA